MNINWATGGEAAISPYGWGNEIFNKTNAIPAFWNAVSIDTAVIWDGFNLNLKKKKKIIEICYKMAIKITIKTSQS